MDKNSTEIISRNDRRRMYNKFGVLIKKNQQTDDGRELRDRLQQDSMRLHELNTNQMNDSISDQLQSTLNNIKCSWELMGYNSIEIKLLEEAWILTTMKNKKTHKSDKKKANRLNQDANNMKNKRLNANDNS